MRAETGQAGGETGTSTGRRSGRKSGDGTTEVPDFPEIKKATAELMRRYKKLEHARDDYNDAVAKVAERTHCNARNLNKLVKSSAKGTFKEAQRDADQQSTLFEMVGEVSGSGTGE